MIKEVNHQNYFLNEYKAIDLPAQCTQQVDSRQAGIRATYLFFVNWVGIIISSYPVLCGGGVF